MLPEPLFVEHDRRTWETGYARRRFPFWDTRTFTNCVGVPVLPSLPQHRLVSVDGAALKLMRICMNLVRPSLSNVRGVVVRSPAADSRSGAATLALLEQAISRLGNVAVRTASTDVMRALLGRLS